MSNRDKNLNPEGFRRLHIPHNIDWEGIDNDPLWGWPNHKFKYKEEDIFESLHAEFNSMAFAIQDPLHWFYDVHELSSTSETREEFEAALRNRRDERFKQIEQSWRSIVMELILKPTLWENPQMDRSKRWNSLIDISHHFSFDSIVAHFAHYSSHRPDADPEAASRTLKQPEQPQEVGELPQEERPDPDDAELRSHLQEMINSVTEDNKRSTVDKLTWLYQTRSKDLVNSTLLDMMVSYVGSREKRVDSFYVMVSGFIAALETQTGGIASTQFVRYFIDGMEERCKTRCAAAGVGQSHQSASRHSPRPPSKKAGKAKATQRTNKPGPGQKSRVEKSSSKRRRANRSNTPAPSEGVRRSARLQERAARRGAGR
ncbi:hypothetical protein F4808DRAFT_465447 [Astrocystis sublimbata]|nr:hypothetical protein F4808DRAFT_465447 [Astrocystis sublimbata]